jgi:hypothetical protein
MKGLILSEILIVTLLIALANVGTYGQVKAEDVFLMGEHFNDECKIETYPDWGLLMILDETRFFSENFAIRNRDNDTLALVGKYRIEKDTLYLSSIKFAAALISLLARLEGKENTLGHHRQLVSGQSVK